MSLSISDYTKLEPLTRDLLEWTDKNMVSLSLPSLRVDSFNKELMDRIASVRTSSLTFAPEAGTQRLRDVINKNVTEADLLHAANVAFSGGKTNVKLYFMNGLPTETNEDIAGIADLAKSVVHAYYQNPNRQKGRSPQVTVSVSCFIPKPFTPFQWEAQDSMEMLAEKQEYLRERMTDRRCAISITMPRSAASRPCWHAATVSSAPRWSWPPARASALTRGASSLTMTSGSLCSSGRALTPAVVPVNVELFTVNTDLAPATEESTRTGIWSAATSAPQLVNVQPSIVTVCVPAALWLRFTALFKLLNATLVNVIAPSAFE